MLQNPQCSERHGETGKFKHLPEPQGATLWPGTSLCLGEFRAAGLNCGLGGPNCGHKIGNPGYLFVSPDCKGRGSELIPFLFAAVILHNTNYAAFENLIRGRGPNCSPMKVADVGEYYVMALSARRDTNHAQLALN